LAAAACWRGGGASEDRGRRAPVEVVAAATRDGMSRAADAGRAVTPINLDVDDWPVLAASTPRVVVARLHSSSSSSS